MGKNKKQRHKFNNWWLRYEYKHTTLAILAIIIFVVLLDTAVLKGIFNFLESLNYAGGFIAGVLAASFFTAAPALVLIIHLSQNHLDALPLALIVGLGSAIGDLLLLLFFEERVFHELRPLFLKSKRLRRLMRKKQKWHHKALWLLAGAFVITTPLPDEVGLGLMGISKFPKAFIFVICLALNTLGMALVILAARAAGS